MNGGHDVANHGERYCESTAGTRPTTGYTQVARLRSMPDFNEAPNGIDVTELDETQYKQYISGLSDPGGAKALAA